MDHTSNKSVPCKFFAHGNCREGDSCQYVVGSICFSVVDIVMMLK